MVMARPRGIIMPGFGIYYSII